MTTILIGLILSVGLESKQTTFQWSGVVPMVLSKQEQPIEIRDNTDFDLLQQRTDIYVNKDLSEQYAEEFGKVLILTGKL
ncbi:hypothetical protein [Shewanella colwelliana]|uniref:hypothetical protein n=1 Tax=Shewanella colwelliana TaxID=23 RepID=UPI00373541BC